MSTGKIELSVGAIKIGDKHDIFTEEEINNINNKIPELDERVGVIEDEIEEINSSLDNKVNKSEITNSLTPKGNLPYANLPTEGNNIGDYYYCSDGVNGAGNYVWNGASWYFGGNGNDGFVDILSFLENCYTTKNNLFNVETIENGYYLLQDGSKKVSTSFYTSDWIKVDGDKTVYLTRTNPSNNVTDSFSAVYIIIYDTDKNVIGASSNFANNVALPSNAEYIRFSANVDMLQFNLMVSYTENAPYEQYGFYSKYNTKDYYSLEKRVENLENAGVEPSTSYWHGKTMIAYGDSITAGYRLDGHGTENTDNNNVNVYGKIVADDLGMKWINMGRSGYGYSLENSSIGSNATNIINMFNNSGVADVVLLAYGTNDFGLADTPNVPFGEINSDVADTSTFCNSVRSAFDKVISKFTSPETIFLVVLPLPRATQNIPNHTGKTLFDYADAIKQIAIKYNFSVLDLLTESKITVKRDSVARKYYIEGEDNYPADALHLNLEAHRKFVAPILKNKLIELSLNN